MKTIAILLRGFHQLTPKVSKQGRHNTSPTHFDYRDVFFSFIKMIWEPLQSLGYNPDLYISTYHSEIDETLKFLPNVKSILYMGKESNQGLTFLRGIQSISDQYDIYLILRFDLWYKQPITNWMPIFLEQDPQIYVTHREYEKEWNNKQRIGDVMMALNQKGKSLLQNIMERENTLISHWFHLMYHKVTNEGMTVSFLADGFFDSNTSYDSRPECCNPLYIFWGRPYHHKDRPYCL
jgi:hypothetical protein